MRLTRHFDSSEFEVSGSFPHLVKPAPVDSHPARGGLLTVLEPLRDQVGRIVILSGYRPMELNSAVGGAKKSQHRWTPWSAAVDFTTPDTHLRETYLRLIGSFDFDQLIWECGIWLHLSVNLNRNRRDIRTYSRVDRRYRVFDSTTNLPAR